MARRRLTKRQQARVARIQEQRLRRIGHQVESALGSAEASVLAGRVVTRHGRNLVVADEQDRLVHCLFRQNLGHVVCGDRVAWQPIAAGEGVVTALLPRDSVLSRPDSSGRRKPLAANISQLLVVIAPLPEPSGYLIDQYLVAAENIGVTALLVLNKSDLLTASSGDALLHRLAVYPRIGYPLVQVSAKSVLGLAPLQQRLRAATSILVGQSGVGKSSLVNALLPNLDLQTRQVSAATGLGRHTTSTTTLYKLPAGGGLIDSPGVRSFRLGPLEQQQLERGFREFAPYLGHCRFRDCRHGDEPGCALRAAIAAGDIAAVRLDSFRNMAAKLH